MLSKLNKTGSYKETDILGGLIIILHLRQVLRLFFSYHRSYFNMNFLSIASARAGNVIGGGDFKKDRIVPDVIKSLKNGKNFIKKP